MGVKEEEDDFLKEVKHHITETVVEVNIKVGKELGDSPPRKSMREAASSSGGKPETVNIPSGDGATLGDVMDSVEYLKAYLRCHHCYVRSRLDYLQRRQDVLYRKAKLSIEEPRFEYQWQFDEHGNLLDADWSTLDPTEYVDSDPDKDMEEEEDDEEGDA